jgi:HlyD family secretion protein
MSRGRKIGLAGGAVLAVTLLAIVGIRGAAGWTSMDAPTNLASVQADSPAVIRTNREIPTARVTRGEVEVTVHTTGDLRPARTAMLVAPPVSGTLQIVYLANTGAMVEEGEVVVEFDPTEQEYNLEQARFDLLAAEQEITKMRADAAVQAAQDQVALLRARFDVRRAELEVTRNELLSAIDGKKNELNLEEARRRLEQLEQDIASRAASDRAALAVVEERRNKARLSMMQAQQNIDNMKVKSPLRGLVSLKENTDASGGVFFTGMVLPEYRAGDLVWPGRTLAEVLEVEKMEIQAQVAEADRSNLNPGQPVEVKVNAVPEKKLAGRVKSVSSIASRRGFFGGDAQRRFDATFELTELHPELRPGLSTEITILGERLKNALHLPRQALFEKDGKQVVYVRSGKGFEVREVKVKHRTEALVVVEGLEENTEVALVNPEADARKPGKAPPPAGPAMPGGGR